jgi:hypothetical protein
MKILIAILFLGIFSICYSQRKSPIKESNGSTSWHSLVKMPVAPNYPIAGLEIKASGTAVVRVKIDSNGKVIAATFIRGNKFFSIISEKAAQKWVFQHSPQVLRELDLSFVFTLLSSEASANDEITIFRSPNTVEILRKPKPIQLEPRPGSIERWNERNNSFD